MSKATIAVRDLVGKANEYFAADIGTRDGRKMLQSFVEGILLETGNYQGFGYLEQSAVPSGQLPGIIRTEGENTFPDDSRIFMF